MIERLQIFFSIFWCWLADHDWTVIHDGGDGTRRAAGAHIHPMWGVSLAICSRCGETHVHEES